MTKQTIVHKGEAVTYRGQLVGFYDETKDELELDERLAHIEVVLEDAYDHWEIVPDEDLDLAMKSQYADVDSVNRVEKIAEQSTSALMFDDKTEKLAHRIRLQEACSKQDYVTDKQSLILAACHYAGVGDV